MESTLPSFEIDRSSSLPLHRQVEGWLRAQISSGILPPGASLPPRKELCDKLGGINHLTIRQAVTALSREGLLFSVQGRGTFVTEQKKKQLRIGLVLPQLDDEFTNGLANGIQEFFETQREPGSEPIRTVIFDSRRDVQKEIDNIRELQDLPLDGAIILPVAFGDMFEHLVRLKGEHFPMVLIGWIPGIQFDCVNSDDYQGSYEVTRHLLEKGRRRIAWLGIRDLEIAPNLRTDSRLEGHRDAISDFGLPYDRRLIGDMVMSSPVAPFEPSLIEALDRILLVEPALDAIVCSDDNQALVCLRELEKRGKRVPQDISVVGFDDLKEAATCRPPLTTLRTPRRELGREAAKLILAKIQNPTRPIQSITLPVTLIARQSA